MSSYGLMLHHFYGAGHPNGQGAISGDEFADILEYMGPSNFLPPHEWMDRALAGRLDANHRCITFDDALRCQVDVALPVLDAYGLKAFFFVYSSVFEGTRERTELFRHYRTVRYDDVETFYADFFATIERSLFSEEWRNASRGFDPASYLSIYPFYTRNDRVFRYARDVVLGREKYFALLDQMIAADASYDADAASASLWMNDGHLRHLDSAGHEIGLHSYSHPTALADLNKADQRSEYVENIRHLTGVFGRQPVAMSHPLNSYSAETLDVLGDLGLKIGFRDNLFSPENPSLLEMPREDHANILRQMHS